MKIRAFRLADEAIAVDIGSRYGLLRAWNNPHQDIARQFWQTPGGR